MCEKESLNEKEMKKIRNWLEQTKIEYGDITVTNLIDRLNLLLRTDSK